MDMLKSIKTFGHKSWYSTIWNHALWASDGKQIYVKCENQAKSQWMQISYTVYVCIDKQSSNLNTNGHMKMPYVINKVIIPIKSQYRNVQM